ncbi:MAG: hypothetical protein V4629_10555 [Pseudomonadota bacterium]
MTTYAVRITGKILDGFESGQVRASLKELFKLTDERVEKFLYGGPVTVKQHLAPSVALKYQKTLNQIGLETEVEREEEVVTDKSEPIPETKISEKSLISENKNTQPEESIVKTFNAQPIGNNESVPQSVKQPQATEQPIVQAKKIGQEESFNSSESFNIAPVGAQIGPSSPDAPPPPDVSHLSSSEIGDRLEPEKPPPPPPPNTDHFKLDPVGTTLAKPKEFIELDLDLSYLSLDK